MVDCNDCVLRKAMAKYCDIHWLGKEDCPLECPFGKTEPSFGAFSEK